MEIKIAIGKRKREKFVRKNRNNEKYCHQNQRRRLYSVLVPNICIKLLKIEIRQKIMVKRQTAMRLKDHDKVAIYKKDMEIRQW